MKTAKKYDSDISQPSDFESPFSFIGKWIPAFAAVLTLSSMGVQAQDEDEDVFELSPFSIDASDNQGYAATSTLAGTRLNTNLRDIAASISVVTKDFLEDSASTDLKELLIYTPSTEVIGPLGNLANEGGRSGENTVTEIFDTLSPTTRVRGLASATLTRNLYESNLPMDSYNVDRVTMNRGANSILFGVGSPAGIIDTTNIAPVFRDATELTARAGSYGSYRGTFDLERVLIEDKMSVRIAGLMEDTKYQQRPAFERDKRLFATLSWRPTDTLSINVNTEQGDIDSNLPRQFPLVNMVSIWFDPLARPDGLVQPTHNALTTTGNGTYGRSYNGPNSAIFVPQVAWSESGSGSVNTSLNANGTAGMLNLKQKFWHPAGSPNRQADWWASIRGSGRNQEIWNGGVNSEISGEFTNNQITDTSIIDFRNHLIDGDTKGESLKFDTYNASIEQLFWDNNIGVELSYDKQTNSAQSHRLLAGGRSEALQIDPTEILPDGSVNPNLGRPLVGFNNGSWSKADNDSNVFRTTAFIKLNASERTDGLISKLVGNHTITGLFETRDASSYNRRGHQYKWGIDYAEFGTYTNGKYVNASLPRVSGHRNFGGIIYLGDSLYGTSTPAGANLLGSIPTLEVEDSYTITVHNPKTDAWENKSFSVEKNPAIAGSKSRLERDSEALVVSSRFWDDHIVATYGWRKDSLNSFAENAPITSPGRYPILDDPDFQVLDTSSGSEDSDTTFSWGVVGHAPNGWIENLPVSSLSAHYSTAENRVASASVRHDLFGRELASPRGETEEHGIAFGLFEDRVSVRATWYKTVQSLRTETGLSALNGLLPFVLNRVGENARAVIDENFYEQDDIENLANYPAEPADIAQAWNIRDDGTGTGVLIWDAPSALATTSDGVSEGFELEAVGNITSNWTISLNATKQKVSRSNTAPEYQEYLYGDANRAALWEQDQFGQYPSALGNLFTIGERIDLIYLSPLNLARQQDGSGSVDQIREWRFNMFTNYRFESDSKLKGFTVGGGARWQDEAAIGHPQIFDSALDGFKPDITNPHFGPSEFNMDGFVRYNKPIMDDKVNMTLTLHVRNLLDDDDLIPVAANPNEASMGLVAVWRIPTERTYSLTAKFKF
jgi:outer membrane receptor protein involved in Fe transport